MADQLQNEQSGPLQVILTELMNDQTKQLLVTKTHNSWQQEQQAIDQQMLPRLSPPAREDGSAISRARALSAAFGGDQYAYGIQDKTRLQLTRNILNELLKRYRPDVVAWALQANYPMDERQAAETAADIRRLPPDFDELCNDLALYLDDMEGVGAENADDEQTLMQPVVERVLDRINHVLGTGQPAGDTIGEAPARPTEREPLHEADVGLSELLIGNNTLTGGMVNGNANAVEFFRQTHVIANRLQPQVVREYLIGDPVRILFVDINRIKIELLPAPVIDTIYELRTQLDEHLPLDHMREYFTAHPTELLRLAGNGVTSWAFESNENIPNEHRELLRQMLQDLSSDTVREHLDQHPEDIMRMNHNIALHRKVASFDYDASVASEVTDVIEARLNALTPDELRRMLRDDPSLLLYAVLPTHSHSPVRPELIQVLQEMSNSLTMPEQVRSRISEEEEATMWAMKATVEQNERLVVNVMQQSLNHDLAGDYSERVARHMRILARLLERESLPGEPGDANVRFRDVRNRLLADTLRWASEKNLFARNEEDNLRTQRFADILARDETQLAETLATLLQGTTSTDVFMSPEQQRSREQMRSGAAYIIKNLTSSDTDQMVNILQAHDSRLLNASVRAMQELSTTITRMPTNKQEEAREISTQAVAARTLEHIGNMLTTIGYRQPELIMGQLEQNEDIRRMVAAILELNTTGFEHGEYDSPRERADSAKQLLTGTLTALARHDIDRIYGILFQDHGRIGRIVMADYVRDKTKLYDTADLIRITGGLIIPGQDTPVTDRVAAALEDQYHAYGELTAEDLDELLDQIIPVIAEGHAKSVKVDSMFTSIDDDGITILGKAEIKTGVIKKSTVTVNIPMTQQQGGILLIDGAIFTGEGGPANEVIPKLKKAVTGRVNSLIEPVLNKLLKTKGIAVENIRLEIHNGRLKINVDRRVEHERSSLYDRLKNS